LPDKLDRKRKKGKREAVSRTLKKDTIMGPDEKLRCLGRGGLERWNSSNEGDWRTGQEGAQEKRKKGKDDVKTAAWETIPFPRTRKQKNVEYHKKRGGTRALSRQKSGANGMKKKKHQYPRKKREHSHRQGRAANRGTDFWGTSTRKKKGKKSKKDGETEML